MAGTEVSDDDLVAQWQNVTAGVARTQRRIDQLIEDSGVPAQWFAVLHLLLDSDDHRMPMSALARDVSMTSGGFTKLADRMAREGLIDRRGSADDRRVVHAALTGDGLKLARKAAAIHRNALRECLLGNVSARDLAAAASTMRALSAAHAAAVEADEAAAAEVLKAERGPALPDRRERGRASTETHRRSGPPYPAD